MSKKIAGGILAVGVIAGIAATQLPSALAQTAGVTLQSNAASMTRGCFNLELDGGYAFLVHLSVPVQLPDGGMLSHEVDANQAIEVGAPPIMQALQQAAQNRLAY